MTDGTTTLPAVIHQNGNGSSTLTQEPGQNGNGQQQQQQPTKKLKKKKRDKNGNYRGGAREGAGRHPKDCTCEKCQEKYPTKDDDEQEFGEDWEDSFSQYQERSHQPGENDQQQQAPANQEQTGTNQEKEQPAENNQQQQAPPNQEQTGTNQEQQQNQQQPGQNNQQQQQPLQPPPAQPAQPKARVFISGKMVLLGLNFLFPPVFAKLNNLFAEWSGSNKIYTRENFHIEYKRDLSPEEYEDMCACAAQVAQELLANMSPMQQLVTMYAIVSLSKGYFD